ncbi:hypothetical protein MKW98_021897 [Papaver atlanticum]|uniref:Uncharacterized protein n=1 Tax=Papaver atlanticum TaxID=357466 RepID=A0AAD4TNU5_9MAGN|nr:hypothetical protein MKW98_021897 [Papaver atlanticum]
MTFIIAFTGFIFTWWFSCYVRLDTSALVILGCSYWKLLGNLDNRKDENGEQDRNLENGDEKSCNQALKIPIVYEEKIVGIMAGDEKPRFYIQ